MRMSPHVGGSVYTPKRTVDSNRRGSASQRTRLIPVSNRVDRLDGSAGRVPPPLTMTWVEDILTCNPQQRHYEILMRSGGSHYVFI